MILRVLLSFSLATIILGNPISQTKDVNYRLPTTYLPVSYEVTLIVNSKTFKGEDDTFTGTVKINIVKNTNEATTELKLHSSNSYITINSIKVDDVVLESNRYAVDPDTDILTISEIDQETLTLEISFTGKHADDMYGFYLSKYPGEDGTTKYLVTTQFQGTYGRRAFPMFDEPEFKATFKISIRHPSGLTALSNTEGKTTKFNEQQEITEFEETPIMSSYLVAFVVSEFKCEYSTVQTSVPHSVCSREEMKSWRGLALEDGPKILSKLNEYTGIDYKESIGKMHQVAIPDFSAGAMENWGLATYRETALLWNEDESSNRYKQRVSTVISHEFAHMWFGNLVTTKWWSTTFLNEGFATLFEMFTTNEVHPDWELDKQFILEDQQAALEADSLITAQTLESDVGSPEEVMGKFGTITYSKGGSILRMVQNFLGLENFKKGVQDYLQDRKYSTAEPSQLWTILGKSATEASKVPEVGLNEVMTNWVTKSGFPLVKVVSTDNGVQLTQERFLFGAKEDTPSRWYVPITYTQSTDEKKFESTLPQLWLTLDESPVTISTTQGSEWIILNNKASAFYRVNYDDALWDKISAALLKENFDGIDELNRAQIADDVFALAKTDYLKYSQVFKITEFLTNDVSYYPWYSAYAGFNFLLRRVGSSSDLGQSIQKLIVERMTKLVESVPFDELNNTDQIYTHKLVLALGWACRLGLESCKTPAVAAFKAYKDTDNRPDPNLRSIIYCNGLRYSENIEDWEFLWKKFQETSEATEQVTLISALGCTENKDLLNKYLENSLDANLVRPQDASSVYSAVYTSGSEVGVDVAFEFLVNNHQKIAESYKSMNALVNIVRGIAERFTTQEHIEKLKGLIPNLEEGTSFHSAASSAVSTAEANLAWVTNKIPELEDFFKELDPTSSSTADPTSSSTADPTSSSTADPTSSSTADPTSSSTADPTSSSTADPTSSSTQDPTTPSTEDPTTEDLISSTTDKPVETSTKASSNIIKIPVFLILTLISINFLI